MKLGYFTDSYLPNVDGVVRSIIDIRGELERRGHEVTVFAPGSKSEISGEMDSGVLRYRSVKFPPYPQYKLAVFPYYSTRKTVRELGIEAVHCHTMAMMGIAGRDAAKRARIPSVATFNTLVPKGISTIARRKWARSLGEAVLWKAMDWFYSPFDLITVPSRSIAAVLAGRGFESTVIPNPVDIRRLRPLNKAAARRSIAAKVGLLPGEKILLWAGRQSKEKNIDVLLRAFPAVAREADVRFVLTGDGPARRELEAIARRSAFSRKIVFTGFVSEQDLLQLYNAADVFGIASTFETQGLALLEAMACGVPVVGADSLAIPEVVHDNRNGFLFEPFDEQACAEKILKVLGAGAARKKLLSQKARCTAEKFAVEPIAGKWERAYSKLL